MDSSDSMRGLNKEDNSELNGSKADIMSIAYSGDSGHLNRRKPATCSD